MGQYHWPVNIDKQEYLYPHTLGSGLKMVECIWNTGVPAALITLLACSHMRGGGDVKFEDYARVRIAGRWAGDRIIMLGDYTEPGDPGTDALWQEATEQGYEHPLQYVENRFTDISVAVREALMYDDSIAEDMGKEFGGSGHSVSLPSLAPIKLMKMTQGA